MKSVAQSGSTKAPTPLRALLSLPGETGDTLELHLRRYQGKGRIAISRCLPSDIGSRLQPVGYIHVLVLSPMDVALFSATERDALQQRVNLLVLAPHGVTIEQEETLLAIAPGIVAFQSDQMPAIAAQFVASLLIALAQGWTLDEALKRADHFSECHGLFKCRLDSESEAIWPPSAATRPSERQSDGNQPPAAAAPAKPKSALFRVGTWVSGDYHKSVTIHETNNHGPVTHMGNDWVQTIRQGTSGNGTMAADGNFEVVGGQAPLNGSAIDTNSLDVSSRSIICPVCGQVEGVDARECNGCGQSLTPEEETGR